MNKPSSLRRTVLSVLAGTGLLVAGALAAGSAAAGPAAAVPTIPTVTAPTVTLPPLPPPPRPPTVTTPPLPPPPRPPTVTTTAPPPRPAPTPPPVPTVPRVQAPSVPTPAPVGSQRAAAPAAAGQLPQRSPRPRPPDSRLLARRRHRPPPSSQSQPSTQSEDPPPGSAGSSVWVLQTSSSTGSTARGEYPRVKLTKFRPSRARFVNRGKKKATTVISFRLSRPVQILLVVKGPGPSCERVGRGQIAGRAGLNRVRFDGTVRNKPLKPGTYRLDARLRAGGRLLASSYVTIIDPQKPFKQLRPPRLLARQTGGSARACLGSERGRYFHRDPRTPVQRKASEPAKPKTRTPGGAGERAQVLGERTPPEAGGVPIGVSDGGAISQRPRSGSDPERDRAASSA